MITFIFLISIVFNVMSQSFDNTTCIFTDEVGDKYDLTRIKHDTFWKIKDESGDSGVFTMDYIFNFCKMPSMKCKGSEVAAFEVLEVLGQMTDTCEVLGRHKEQENMIAVPIPISQGTPGLRITYSHGDMCSNSENPSENGQARNINFNIICSSSQDETFVQDKINSQTITKCNLQFSIKSPAGCAGGSSGIIYYVKQGIYDILCMLLLYIIIGTAINYQQGIQDINAIPHLEFWKELPMHLITFSKIMINNLQIMGSFLMEKFGQQQQKQQYNYGGRSQGRGLGGGYRVI